MKKKSTRCIPQGLYCYTLTGKSTKEGFPKIKPCPYWKIIEGRPEQMNGWCDYLGKGDLEFAKEGVESGSATITKWRDGKEIRRKMTRKELEQSAGTGIFSLLWDSCKSCGIKDEIPEDWDPDKKV